MEATNEAFEDDDNSTSTCPFEWTNEPVDARLFLFQRQLPQVVRLSGAFHESLTDGQLTGNSNAMQPFLLYTARRGTKVFASNLAQSEDKEEYNRQGPALVVPVNYQGWFELMPENGSIVEIYETIEQLATANIKRFLIRSTTPALTLHRDLDQDVWVRGMIPPGVVLSVYNIHKLPSKKKRGSAVACCFQKVVRRFRKNYPISTEDDQTDRKFLQCLDSNGKEYTLSFEQVGLFSPLGEPGTKTPDCVYQLSTIVRHMELPLRVRLVYGEPPISPCPFSGVLTLEETYNDETIIACTINKDKNVMLEISVDSKVKFIRASNYEQYKDYALYKDILRQCDEKIDVFASSINITQTAYVPKKERSTNDSSTARNSATRSSANRSLAMRNSTKRSSTNKMSKPNETVVEIAQHSPRLPPPEAPPPDPPSIENLQAHLHSIRRKTPSPTVSSESSSNRSRPSSSEESVLSTSTSNTIQAESESDVTVKADNQSDVEDGIVRAQLVFIGGKEGDADGDSDVRRPSDSSKQSNESLIGNGNVVIEAEGSQPQAASAQSEQESSGSGESKGSSPREDEDYDPDYDVIPAQIEDEEGYLLPHSKRTYKKSHKARDERRAVQRQESNDSVLQQIDAMFRLDEISDDSDVTPPRHSPVVVNTTKRSPRGSEFENTQMPYGNSQGTPHASDTFGKQHRRQLPREVQGFGSLRFQSGSQRRHQDAGFWRNRDDNHAFRNSYWMYNHPNSCNFCGDGHGPEQGSLRGHPRRHDHRQERQLMTNPNATIRKHNFSRSSLLTQAPWPEIREDLTRSREQLNMLFNSPQRENPPPMSYNVNIDIENNDNTEEPLYDDIINPEDKSTGSDSGRFSGQEEDPISVSRQRCNSWDVLQPSPSQVSFRETSGRRPRTTRHLSLRSDSGISVGPDTPVRPQFFSVADYDDDPFSRNRFGSQYGSQYNGSQCGSVDEFIPPDDLSGLSVNEVARALRYIGMYESVVQDFVDESIDGKMLLELNENLLCEGFPHMNGLERKKVVKFIKGWRPRKD